MYDRGQTAPPHRHPGASGVRNRDGMKILTLCGSLRIRSSNRAILRAYAAVAPANLQVGHFEGLGTLPHFNPDLDGETVPAEVAELRQLVAAADAIVMSTPEYVH